VRIYWRPRRSPFGVSMPWWLGLPVLIIWAVVVVGIYMVIGLLWGLWWVGHGIAGLFSRGSTGTAHASTTTTVITSDPSSSSSTLLPPASMEAQVPKELADLRTRFQAELDAAQALPNATSRLDAEIEIRKRFDVVLDSRLESGMTPEQRARYGPVIQAQRRGARLEFGSDGRLVGWWEDGSLHPFDTSGA
jgi:hypothetical protein